MSPTAPSTLSQLQGDRPSFLTRNQVPQRQVIHHVFNLLDVVLDAVDTLSELVVLQVEQLEASVDVLDEGADAHGQLAVSQGHGVDGKAAQLVGKASNGEKVLLRRDVKGVTVLEVNGNWGLH